MKRSTRWLLLVGLLALILAIPAAVVARGEQEATEAEDEETLKEFEPSERIDADESISFPVDI